MAANVHKRYLLHVAGHNLGLLMRQLIGAGTPKEAAERAKAVIFVLTAHIRAFFSLLIRLEANQPGFLIIGINEGTPAERGIRQRAAKKARF